MAEIPLVSPFLVGAFPCDASREVAWWASFSRGAAGFSTGTLVRPEMPLLRVGAPSRGGLSHAAAAWRPEARGVPPFLCFRVVAAGAPSRAAGDGEPWVM